MSCSTTKNRSINKAYHSMVSSYNVLFNGSSSVEEGIQEEYSETKEDYWDILPIEKIKLSDDIITVDGINNKNFLLGEEKAAKTIQKHSMLIGGNQENRKISNAYFLLGKARYLDQRFVPAIDAFNQVKKQKSTPFQINQASIWIAKCNIRLEQEALAIKGLKNLLKDENLNQKNISSSNAVISMAYMQLEDYENAEKFLILAATNENNILNKSRYMFIVGQLLEKRLKYDSANVYFKKVSELKRKIPRELYINSKLKNIIYDSIDFELKKKQIFKMLDNYENEEFLDKVYFNYSTLLFSIDSLNTGEKYLNKSIKNNTDKKLLFRAYNKLANRYYEKLDYVKSKKYLDSALQNLDKKSKKYWEIERQQKGLDKIVELEEKIELCDSLIKISGYDSKKLNEILMKTEVKRRYKKPTEMSDLRNSNFSSNNLSKSNFYFYNTDLVELGKKSFKSNWGIRKRETYWRVSNAVSEIMNSKLIISEDRAVEKKEIALKVDESLISLVPREQEQKDSIIYVRNKSIINLAELYFIKYSDSRTALSKLNKLVGFELDEGMDSNAKYLMYKIYVKSDKLRANEIRDEIILKYPESKFAKILKNPNNLKIEKEFLIQRLDSLQTFFNQRKFKSVIDAVNIEVTYIDDVDVLVDYELLKAESIGRLEGILSYQEELKKLNKNYPNSYKSEEINNIINQINRKWKNEPKLEKSGIFFLIFQIASDKPPQKYIDELKSTLNIKNKVLFQEYNYDYNLIVVKGFENKDSAEEIITDIQKNSELFRLINNFVVLSSQYKNMLIYKTLEKN